MFFIIWKNRIEQIFFEYDLNFVKFRSRFGPRVRNRAFPENTEQ